MEFVDDKHLKPISNWRHRQAGNNDLANVFNLCVGRRINLQNINFPNGSLVNLKSLYGPLDGKYPTFGTANQQPGRVNFLQNVQYNLKLLNSRSAFDAYGGNISISGK